MPYCFASARGRFDPLGPWRPTNEHFPLAKQDGGVKGATNAVLAHRRCNNIGYKIEELREHLETIDGIGRCAIEAAIADNIGQRRTDEGRYPRKSGSRKRAVRVAREAQQALG
jgi:hypothetical protein